MRAATLAMAWISSGRNKQKLLWHMKASETLCGGAKEWRRRHTAEKGSGRPKGWCSSWLGELWVSAGVEETSRGFWRALGIRGSHVGDSLLKVQRGGSSHGAQLRSQASAHGEMGPASEKISGKEPQLGLGWPEENQLQVSHVMVTCPPKLHITWQILEFAQPGIAQEVWKEVQRPAVKVLPCDFQAEQRSPPGTADTSRHWDRHKLAAAVCNVLITKIGIFPFFFFNFYVAFFLFLFSFSFFFYSFIFPVTFFCPSFSFPSPHFLVTHAVNSTANHLLEVGDSTQSNTNYLREGSGSCGSGAALSLSREGHGAPFSQVCLE